MTCGIYYYVMTEFDCAKRDSRRAAYGGVVLQRFEFIIVCIGTQPAGHRHRSQVRGQRSQVTIIIVNLR